MTLPRDGISMVLFSIGELTVGAEKEMTTRAQLINFLYLCDLSRPSYGEWVTGFRYQQSREGLSSRGIETALLFLASNRVVNASYGSNDAEVALSSAGRALIRDLQGRAVNRLSLQVVRDLYLALRGVSASTLASICRVVYSEESFREAQLAARDGRPHLPFIGTPYHPAVQAQAVVEKFLQSDEASPPQRSDVLVSHLRYLGVLAETRRQGLGKK